MMRRAGNHQDLKVVLFFLMEQNEEDDLTDGEIEVEFVPSDPFLFDNNDYDEHKDDQTTKFQENIKKKETFQIHQIEAEVHHGMTIHQTQTNIFFDLFYLLLSTHYLSGCIVNFLFKKKSLTTLCISYIRI